MVILPDPTPRPDGETRPELREQHDDILNDHRVDVFRPANSAVAVYGWQCTCDAEGNPSWTEHYLADSAGRAHIVDHIVASLASLTEDLAATRAEIAELKSDEWSERLFEQRDQAIAERDALLRLRDKAVFWRESLSLVRQIDASDEELALAEALGLPIRIFTQPTEEAGSGS